MPNERITIKDIAEKAGVSVGTVDRVLHKRPNVSKKSLSLVTKALEEMNYEPNMYASALANSRRYDFYCLMPKHESEAYWEEVEQGQHKCCDARRDFHVHVTIKYYKRNDVASFNEQSRAILDANPDGVILVPAKLDITRPFTERNALAEYSIHHVRFLFPGFEASGILWTRLFRQWLFCSQDAYAYSRK